MNENQKSWFSARITAHRSCTHNGQIWACGRKRNLPGVSSSVRLQFVPGGRVDALWSAHRLATAKNPILSLFMFVYSQQDLVLGCWHLWVFFVQTFPCVLSAFPEWDWAPLSCVDTDLWRFLFGLIFVQTNFALPLNGFNLPRCIARKSSLTLQV